MEFLFGSLSLINIHLFGEKFGDNIKEIKIVCYKRKFCVNISQFFNISCNEKCNLKLINKNILDDL